MNGTDLLTQFRESRSEVAFTELVRRYTNLVYSAARRRLPDTSLAQEAAQLVFIRLAKAAPKLGGDAELVAWLHRTTFHVSIDLWRSETRRRAREEKAATMQLPPDENAAWPEITPILDEALNDLDDAERQTILLRFFEHKTMRDLGAVFGVSEDAAKMRVSRALERLRQQFKTRGVTCGALALGALLAERSVEAAPSQVAAALSALSPHSSAFGTGAPAQLPKVKLAVGVGAVILIGAISFVLLRSPDSTLPPNSSSSDIARTPADAAAGNASPNAPDATATATSEQPDPLKLLQAVARERNRIASGSMELQAAMDHIADGRRFTNSVHLNIVFDGDKQRFESVGREYAHVVVGSEAAATNEARIKELGLSQEAAVQAGLLNGFEAHTVTLYDGTVLLSYRESDGRPEGAAINDPTNGSSSYLFDPRCLGLNSSPSMRSTVERCLGLQNLKSARLVGREPIEDSVAWHVQVLTSYDALLDFWIDATHPGRVLKYAQGHDVTVSRYDDASPGNPIPVEVSTTSDLNGQHWFSRHFSQSKAQLNIPVAPATWTLAGLGMKVGTDVGDDRIHRRIGYWTGAGLDDGAPKKEGTPLVAPDRAELSNLLETDPTSIDALDGAVWIVLNTPDGPEVEKAADVIQQHHIRSPDLLNLARELERVRPRCSGKLLEALVEQNPNADIQATACFTEAILLKDAAKYGEDRKAFTNAIRFFERSINEFRQTGKTGASLARRAEPELTELRNLSIGRPAPAIEGEDLDGRPMKLSEYRGRIVVLFFWTASTDSDAAEQRAVLEQIPGKPFVLIGVNCDRDATKAKAAAEKYQFDWPSFRGGNAEGPIFATWPVNSWLTTFVIDARGVIRSRNVRDRALVNAIETLRRE